MLHVGNELLHLDDVLAEKLVIRGRSRGRNLHLFSLQLESEALDGQIHLLDSLVAKILINLLALGVGAVIARTGNGREFERKRELVVRFGNDFGFLGVELELVVERYAAVFDGIGVAVTVSYDVALLV